MQGSGCWEAGASGQPSGVQVRRRKDNLESVAKNSQGLLLLGLSPAPCLLFPLAPRPPSTCWQGTSGPCLSPCPPRQLSSFPPALPCLCSLMSVPPHGACILRHQHLLSPPLPPPCLAPAAAFSPHPPLPHHQLLSPCNSSPCCSRGQKHKACAASSLVTQQLLRWWQLQPWPQSQSCHHCCVVELDPEAACAPCSLPQLE